MHNGNDSNDGTTLAKAFKTVHKVLESNSYLTSGQVDTIKVMPSVDGSSSGYYDFGDDVNRKIIKKLKKLEGKIGVIKNWRIK